MSVVKQGTFGEAASITGIAAELTRAAQAEAHVKVQELHLVSAALPEEAVE